MHLSLSLALLDCSQSIALQDKIVMTPRGLIYSVILVLSLFSEGQKKYQSKQQQPQQQQQQK